MKHLGLFAAGVLFGTAGLKILGSKDAKKVYAHTTASSKRITFVLFILSPPTGAITQVCLRDIIIPDCAQTCKIYANLL